MKRPMYLLLSLLLGSSLISSASVPAVPAPLSVPSLTTPSSKQPTLRGLWVDAFGTGLRSAKEVDDVVLSAKKLGVNAIFAQIGKRGDCYCNKASVPRAEDVDFVAGFDALEDLIQKAHKEGIQVHAWMTTTAVRSKQLAAPKNPKHVWNEHGEDQIGPDNWLIYRQDGTDDAGIDYYLDVANPDAAAYITEMYTSIVKNYAVDGIMLDRVRYPDNNPTPMQNFWGYSEVSLERFRRESGFKGTPRAFETTWTAWRREQVNNLVKRIYLEVKAIRPEVWVSAATITYGKPPKNELEFDKTRTFVEVLQDWPLWSRSGWLDLNVMMNYKRGEGEQKLWYSGWNDFAATLNGVNRSRQAAGSAMYLNTPLASFEQAKGGTQTLNGWVGYSYRSPSLEGEKGRDTVTENLGALLGTLEAVGPLGNPAPVRALEGTLRAGKRPATGVKVELWAGGKKQMSTVSDGGGLYGFVNVPKGPLELRITGEKPRALEVETGVVLTLPTLQLTKR